MSKSFYWMEYYKRIASKPNLLENKENVCSSQSTKCIEDNSDVEKKRGLSTGAESRKNDIDRTRSIQKFAIERKTQFQVYRDDNVRNERSRSFVRKSRREKEIERVKDKVQELSIRTKTLGTEKPTSSNIVVPYRTRSLSNQNRISSSGDNKLAAKLSQRACSENRKSSYASKSPVRSIFLKVKSSNKYLSNDVKKRTLCSIEMWKNKMRQSRIDSMPKNPSTTYLAATKTDEMHVKTDSLNTDNIDFLSKISRHENLARSDAPTNEMSSNRMTDVNEDINNKPNYLLQDNTSDVLKSCLSSEFVMSSQTVTNLNTQVDIEMRSRIQDNDQKFTEKVNSNYITPLSSSPDRPSTSIKDKVTSQFSTKKEDFQYIDQELSNNESEDYLNELPDTEREREESAPKLSSSFLRENINVQQRQVIVKYLINLGVHCNYNSTIIYQTVKLFDVAVDRILVNTEQIQLMALACLWIILKRDLTSHKIPTATKILKLAGDVYENQEKCLLIFEKKILSTLKFNVRFANPYSLLMYYISSLDQATPYISRYDINRIYFCSSYLIDVSMLSETLCIISVFVLAITAFELSLDLVLASNPNTDQTWRQSLRNKDTLAIWEEGQISFVKQIMIKLVLESDKVVYRKYQRSRRCKISKFLLESVKRTIEEHMHGIE